MSERTKTLTIAGVLIALAIALLALTSTQPADVDRVEAIGTRIKCPVCQGESIANSPAPMAEDMMDLVAERVSAGATDNEIIDELLTSYTGALLLDPPAAGNTLALWLAPVIAIVVGVAVIAWWKRHPGSDEENEPNPAGTVTGSRARLIVGSVILVACFAGIVLLAGNFLQERAGNAAGVADLGQQNLSEVSNETMEAVIAANLGDPQINGMRLALAERYFDLGDYRSAFPHYLAVAEDASATPAEAITALVRLGWMAFDGNGEVGTATDLIDQALAIDPDSELALYSRARVRWCGAGEHDEAAAVFERLLDKPALAQETRSQIESDLRLARAGEECP